MKRIFWIMLTAFSLVSCRKNETVLSDNIQQILKENLSAEDFGNIDFSTLTQSVSASTRQQLVRVGFKQKDKLHDFVLLSMNEAGGLTNSKIIHIEGSVTKTGVNSKAAFNGMIETSSLKRENRISSVIENGFIRSLHQSKVSLNGVRMNYECADCTLPEVIVSSSHNKTYDWTTAWLSIWSMFGDWPPNEYIPIDYSGGGGSGGGGGSSPDVITIDIEEPENKDRIEPKKYTDCFGTISDGSTTIYTLTISADLPTDGHPEIFYNWTDRSPGHAFIELSKSTPSGGVTQDFGFYPTSSYKLVTLDNVNLDAKIVDDGGHEYQARYTISVTAAQFQAAVNAVNAARTTYNTAFYNCTDFALDVFNAAGGNLSIPRHEIPGFEVDGGSNTPQGLYEKIKTLKDNGTANTTTTNNKEYAGSSKGPCN
jgi:hypothetical protein